MLAQTRYAAVSDTDCSSSNCNSHRCSRLVMPQLPVTERRGVPHHLIDILDIHDEFSAGDFFARAREAIADILQVVARVPPAVSLLQPSPPSDGT